MPRSIGGARLSAPMFSANASFTRCLAADASDTETVNELRLALWSVKVGWLKNFISGQ